MKVLTLLMILLSTNMSFAKVGKAQHKKLMISCTQQVVSNSEICSSSVIHNGTTDVSFELSESLMEQLDQKSISYDSSDIGNQSKLIQCKTTQNLIQSQVCIDQKQITSKNSTHTAYLVEDLF